MESLYLEVIEPSRRSEANRARFGALFAERNDWLDESGFVEFAAIVGDLRVKRKQTIGV